MSRSLPLLWITLWDGRLVLCRGQVDGLPLFTWGWAPKGVATRRQLRARGLCPGGHDPVGVLAFRHRHPGRRRVELASLYRLDLAQPKRIPSPAQRAALARAWAARRICRTCHQDAGYYLPTSTRQCWDCWHTDNDNGDEIEEVA
ncbi:hypothetical protein GCM10012275_62410 [Longimycelium tulufanense]|uniref:Uncharacterized protein n=1 Tax=Longimycelium tulufanense TaxID=907463 RepID=A0A8J3CIY8_9PSEU|nr:RRQRL motif-containing zinc-binding protein [Longimycelium tulufanense]GGM83329.1 hypothetical protein GCM10012275_62410 [Longimycelium tulufanense]